MEGLAKNGYTNENSEKIKEEYDYLMKVLQAEKEDKVFTNVELIREVTEEISEETFDSLKDLGFYLD